MSDVVIIMRGDGETYAELLADQLGERPPVFESAAAVRGEAEQARVILGMPYLIDRALIDRMPNLEWIQVLTAGIDPLLPLNLDPRIRITTARGHHPHVAEHVLLLMLGLSRHVRALIGHQDRREWARPVSSPMAGKTVVIIGVGAIAEMVATRAAAFGMKVIGVSGSRSEAPGFERVVPMEHLIDVAREADFLIPLAPYSERTHHIISREVIAALPAGAFIVNAGRGLLIDEPALIEALAAKRIAGAGLDVFATEPLPADSPLWELPNVLLTPHVAGFTTNFVELITPLLHDNFARWSRGETLRNSARP